MTPIKQSKHKILILVGLLFLMTLAGCSNASEEAYNSALQKGLDALIIEDYNKAEAYFELAIEEKPEDDEATALLIQTSTYRSALSHFEENDLEAAMEEAETVVSYDEATSALTQRGEALLEEITRVQASIERYDAEYKQAEAHFDTGAFDKAQDLTQSLLNNDELSEIYYSDILKASEELDLAITRHLEEEAESKALAEAENEAEKQAEAEAEKARVESEAETSESESTPSLDGYSAKEIEYARILLMTQAIDPDSSIIYVYENPAGTPVAEGYEETVKFPEATTTLFGEYGASGTITYASHGDGNITIYPVPSHWHQEDQSPQGYRDFSQEILDDGVTVYVEPGNNADIINKINSVTFQ